MNPRVTFAILTLMTISITVASWMVYFLVAAVPGYKLYNGMILGLAEAIAMPLFGYFLRFMNDKSAAIFFTVLHAGGNIVYGLIGAG